MASGVLATWAANSSGRVAERNRARGVVPAVQNRAALVWRQNVEAADRPVGLRNHRLQQPHEAARHGLHARALEQIRLIVEPQPHSLAWYGREAQGIVGHV